MMYTDCLKHAIFNQIPFRRTYTKRDVDALQIASLFNGTKTLSYGECILMIKTRAIWLNANFSKFIENWKD